MEKIIQDYYNNNAYKLRKMVNKILLKFGGIYSKDYDDFYSLANVVFTDVIKRYDGERPFDNLLYTALLNKIKTEITKKNRIKRKAQVVEKDGSRIFLDDFSLDVPIGDSETDEYITLLRDESDFESEHNSQEMVNKVFSIMSKSERDMIQMFMDGYTVAEISQKLHKSNRQISNIRNIANTNVNVIRAINIYIKEGTQNAYR